MHLTETHYILYNSFLGEEVDGWRGERYVQDGKSLEYVPVFVFRDQSESGTVSVRDRIHEFDVLFQPSPFYQLQTPSRWRTSPDVVASPTGSVTTGRLPVKAAVARYDGDMFRRQTPTSAQVNTHKPSHQHRTCAQA